MPLLPELPPARNPLYREEDDEDVPEPTPAPPVPPNWSVLTRVLKTEAQDEVKNSPKYKLQPLGKSLAKNSITKDSENSVAEAEDNKY